MAEDLNIADLERWVKTELLRSREDVALLAHHLLLVIAVSYVAVVGVSLWYGQHELVEHGRVWAWWAWPVWAAVSAAFWFLIFVLVLTWTQRVAISIMRRSCRHLYDVNQVRSTHRVADMLTLCGVSVTAENARHIIAGLFADASPAAVSAAAMIQKGVDRDLYAVARKPEERDAIRAVLEDPAEGLSELREVLARDNRGRLDRQ
jgi:hypothetical protein